MKKLLVYLEDGRHEDLKELAHRNKTTMAELVRYAIDKTFEDSLDALAGERILAYAAAHPETTTSWEDYKASRAGKLQASA